jgi:uncharacterized protein (TIGR00297 family)
VGARLLVSLTLGAGVAGLAYTRRALTATGALAASVVGAVVFGRGGLPGSGALLTFFVSSSLLSHWKEAEKRRRGVLAQAKGGQRDAWQVLANGGWPTLWIALGPTRGGGGFLGGLASAAADTWATELGMLARRRPRLITTGQAVPTGTSGAITPEGLLASLSGALAVGGVWSLLTRRNALGLAALAGVGGALIDSLLGATVQAQYWCAGCEEPTEQRLHVRCGQPARRVRGLAWMDNDVVNALATLGGSVIGAALWRGCRVRWARYVS